MFASVFDNGGVAMLVMRPDGAIEKANPVMRGLLGNDGGALEAKCLEESFIPTIGPRCRESVKSFYREIRRACAWATDTSMPRGQ